MTYSYPMDTCTPPLLSIVETPPYLARAEGLMTAEERAEAVLMIARDPECGDLIKGGAGVRKVRFAVGGRGKSGGVRIVYYYYDLEHPAYLLTVFAKKDQGNLTAEQRNKLAQLVKQLISKY